MDTIDIKSATTGTGWLSGMDMKPGVSLIDPAVTDGIDAPNWVPTGSHRFAHEDGQLYAIVYGEVLRGEL